jgi:protein-disulfide isomerase
MFTLLSLVAVVPLATAGPNNKVQICHIPPGNPANFHTISVNQNAVDNHLDFPQLEAEYIQTGKVKYVRRDFPLESIHPHAFKAAEAAHCAQEQGKGWELHGRLFGHQQQLAPTDWPGHAHALGLDASAFQQCLESGKYAARIRQDTSEAQAAGVTGTPSFFLGVSDPSGKVTATRMFKGAQAYAAFKAAIDDLLAEKQ